ncbi:hypothetical protein I8751_06725 [Nostocaceae cyanobacterium CENA357]|uniref:RRXRR domain-containing protein n=1 Tax=Atlanticothrix silvestris CENA357 TaxID=1725252 RepID=A0A8J7L0P5_9CYAN|nr:hypothetical protein [Atlanticothrix silvestris]MBH8552071.1 hypothetical protein [Atlanticothrix silvestris CENA357]
MKLDLLESQTRYPLCVSARQSLQVGKPAQRAALPLREVNHPAFMQRRKKKPARVLIYVY